jgi:hypothetical protein
VALARPRLGAEELIELGQAPLAAAAPAPRTVPVSPEEGRLIIHVVETIVSFAKDYPIEFNSYCPTDRWQEALTQVGTWTKEIERQLERGADTVMVPAQAVFRLVDLEKCVSAARDARLGSAKLAFTLSAAGAIADLVFGLSWIGVPAYIAGLAVLFGRPLMAKLRPEPQEPYKPSLLGPIDDCPADGGAIGDHTDKRKVLERVIVCPGVPVERHHWGRVRPVFGPVQTAVCLAKNRFRVRVEGWLDDRVAVNKGWERVPLEDCDARIEICVWQPSGMLPRRTPFGPVPGESGHPETYWVEYVGPLTDGARRVAGPFG